MNYKRYCGKTDEYCGIGCKTNFNKCGYIKIRISKYSYYFYIFVNIYIKSCSP